MNKHNTKKLSTAIQAPNKYKFVIIKRPNGLITVCRSSYLSQEVLNKLSSNKENINISDLSKTDYISVDVDYTQYLIQNKDKKKQHISLKQKSMRSIHLNTSFLKKDN